MSQPFLRQRKALAGGKRKSLPEVHQHQEDEQLVNVSKTSKGEPVVWGKTPGGQVFQVPTTHDVLTALFHPAYPKSHFDILNLFLLSLQLFLFFTLPASTARVFFFLYFTFWRAAYDAGLGWVLTLQSKRKWIVRKVERFGWLDEGRRPLVRNWIKEQLVGKMGKDYSFDDLPLEYNTWLLFRQVVDVILINDFLAYCMFAFSCFRVPDNLSVLVHIMRWIGGIALIGFNLWVKTEAHDVVKDYGWYWGDVFFQRGALVFNGVFELAPHPMYSVGYAGYYGLSLISGSYRVLFVSLAAHAAQFAFLVFFENPHIERMYGQRKPIAKRIPVATKKSRSSSSLITTTALGPDTEQVGEEAEAEEGEHLLFSADELYEMSTPAVTEGETATETELETCCTETETEEEHERDDDDDLRRAGGSSSQDQSGFAVHHGLEPSRKKTKTITKTTRTTSQHDLLNIYFRRDTLFLKMKNFDIFRSNDFMLCLLTIYGIAAIVLPSLNLQTALYLHFCHALSWIVFHCFGLGIVLKAQSDGKFLVRHFVKHYHYPQDDITKGAVVEAFANWKAIYNTSHVLSYLSVIGVAWQTYSFPTEWTVGDQLLRHTLGMLLIALHYWASKESFEVLGAFGWFYGDFFMEDFPSNLEYSGIYRYLNNPEIMGGAAYLGLSLISGSKLVLVLAVVRHLSHWWFLSFVENPHMQKLYGDSLRNEAGFVKVIKNVASKNARILESRAGRHAPELKRVAKEVKGTFDKVFEETADVVEEFLARSRPRLTEVMQDTKIMLQQSRERLVITRVANDISAYDTTKYRISINSGSNGGGRFHLGEPITVRWTAPRTHSRKDWIGIYRVGANKNSLVTKVSSMGMWVPLYDGEWDGDIYLGGRESPNMDSDTEKGIVRFSANQLPWTVGRYEIRYHHDGKYNVMATGGPFEIFVEQPEELDFASVRSALMHIVPLCLDSDPSLIPLSCRSSSSTPSSAPGTPTLGNVGLDSASVATGDERDPDDFTFWSEGQAKRICTAIKQSFGVEYVPEVIVADANLTALANRILHSKEMLTTS